MKRVRRAATTAGALPTVALTALFLTAAPLVGCEDRGSRAEVNVDFACAIGEDCITMSQPEHCLVVSATLQSGGQRRTIPLIDPDDVRDGGFSEIHASSGEDFDFDFFTDQIGDNEEITLEIRYVPGQRGVPTLGATLENVTAELLASETLNVRLYPIGRWSSASEATAVCSTDGVLSDAPGCLPRALHAAIPLANGDVLIFGGVSGLESITTNSDLGEPVRTVDYYDHSAHAYVAVEVDGSIDDAELERVLFGWRYLGFTGGEHRIRLIGGVRSDGGGGGVVAFDEGGRRGDGIGGAFVFPAGDAVPAGTHDLFLDTSGAVPRVARIVDIVPMGEPPGTLLALSEPQPDLSGNAPDASGVAFPQLVGDPGALEIGRLAYELTPNGDYGGDNYALVHPRVGASVTPISGGSSFVWGGNFEAMMSVDPGPDAAEVHTAGVAVAAPVVGVADPTAFHRAAPFGPDLVLVVGGFRVRAASNGAFTDPPTFPIRVLEIGADVRPINLPTGAYESTVLHTLTDLGGGRFLVTGGGAVSDDLFSRFKAIARAGVVTFAGYELLDDPLNEARLGHTATRLPGNRVLVHGGFATDDSGTLLNGLSRPGPEMIYLGEVGEEITDCMSIQRFRDGGPPVDAGPPSRTDAGSDAGVDAGFDGGAPTDAGMPDAG